MHGLIWFFCARYHLATWTVPFYYWSGAPVLSCNDKSPLVQGKCLPTSRLPARESREVTYVYWADVFIHAIISQLVLAYICYRAVPWTWPPWVICTPVVNHKIGNAAHSVRQYIFEDLQRCANSRWLTDGSDHNSNNNSSMWPDNMLAVLSYFFAAIPTLNVS